MASSLGPVDRNLYKHLFEPDDPISGESVVWQPSTPEELQEMMDMWEADDVITAMQQAAGEEDRLLQHLEQLAADPRPVLPDPDFPDHEVEIQWYEDD